MPTRTLRLAPLALAILAVGLAAEPAAAQRPRVKFDNVQIGLPPGRFTERDASSQKGSYVVKRNTWAPVYVRLEVVREVEGGARLKIETADADDLRTTLVVPLIRNLSDRLPGSKIEPVEFATIPYVRTGDRSGQVTLTVLSDTEDKAISDAMRLNYLQFHDVSNYVVLSLGSRLPGFDLPQEKTAGAGTRGALRNGRVETAAITNVREMPDQWFGYQAADLVVLTTGSAQDQFLAELFDAQQSIPFKDRRDALLEWVRRGGKLVVSVGSNGLKLAPSELFQSILPAQLKLDPPTKAVSELPLRWQVPGGAPTREFLRPKADSFPVARLSLNPTRPTRQLLPKPGEDTGDPATADLPIVVQAPYGMGRVTVVAFDLDQSPFLDFAKKPEFWDWLVRTAGSERSALAAAQQNNTYSGYGSVVDTEDEYAGALRQHIDTFEGVPVVSFGWVALFIVLYTLLIGPVEYLFLKKILGRLELTWVTFPLIVLTVSAAAYFTAYAIKGKDLKLNKVDVVDVDLAGGRVYGRTWFTIFSPRIDSYTIGVEPKEGWAVARPDAPPPPTTVDWMGGGRGGSSGILSRGYSYHVDPTARVMCDGLDRVPIQVWSTKAFTASWSGYTDRGTPPVAAELSHPPGQADAVIGSFTNHLPVKALQDPVLFYAGKPYKLPALTPDQRVTVNIPVGLTVDNDWFNRNTSYVSSNNQYNQVYGGRGYQQNAPTVSNLSMWGALFHERQAGKDTRAALQNASLRDLDESWRLAEDNKDEAILVARVDAPAGTKAEDLMTESGSASPTRLWLKGLPGDPQGRQPVPGTMRQETYIRVYIPIRPAGKR